MKILNLNVNKYRTLEDFEIDFSQHYSAICGKNDSGKSNTIKALDLIFRQDIDRYYIIQPEIFVNSEITKWINVEDPSQVITIAATIGIDEFKDSGLYNFITTYLSLSDINPTLCLEIKLIFSEGNSEEVVIKINDIEYDGINAFEVLKKIRSSRCIIVHNSTEQDSPYLYRKSLSMSVLSRDFSPEYENVIDSINEIINNKIQDIAEVQQKEISKLLGRLQEKYSLRLNFREFNPGWIPLTIALGDSELDIPIDDWGSGTRNRTAILITLLFAKQITETESSADKVTPVIIVEEPESFLHPSAQAEFGRVLQDLSMEFDVQVIATTHSPYMLCLPSPESNILLDRVTVNKSLQSTFQVDTTSDNWMQPFGEILGIKDEEFLPWKDLFFTSGSSILLVEGPIDVEYFNLLLDDKHGENKLNFSGEIYSYGGSGNLSNTVLLNFIRNRYKFLVTYDLDMERVIKPCLDSLGLIENEDYIAIGLDEEMNRNIEGLIPQEFRDNVYSKHPNLVQKLISGDKEDKKSAKNEFKKLILDEFKKEAKAGDEEYYSEFYKLVAVLNPAIQKKYMGN